MKNEKNFQGCVAYFVWTCCKLWFFLNFEHKHLKNLDMCLNNANVNQGMCTIDQSDQFTKS